MTETAATRTASDWLALLDAGTWQESWATTGQFFRSRNTAAGGQAASEPARVPLGRMLSRQLLSEADVPAPPKVYRVLRFRSDFVNKRGATETLSLDRRRLLAGGRDLYRVCSAKRSLHMRASCAIVIDCNNDGKVDGNR